MKNKFFLNKHKLYRVHIIYSLPGYIDKFDEYKQQFCLNYYIFWGLIRIKKKVLFEEVIPNYVIYHEWFLPYNSDWKSDCPEELRKFYHWRGQPAR